MTMGGDNLVWGRGRRVRVWGEAGSEAHSHLWEAPRDLDR